MKRIVGVTGKLNWVKRAYAVLALFGATAIASPAQSFTTLQSFNGTDGAQPMGALVQTTNGDLYGTTFIGGAIGSGTIFKITPSGTLTTLYSFCSVGAHCLSGGGSAAGLVQATNGELYGTTIQGGANGGGTIFRMTPNGTPAPLYSFCSQGECKDGTRPWAKLIQATDGDFYGTTQTGGAYGQGTVFKITPSGTLTTLASFQRQRGCNSGVYTTAALVEASNGNFYGTTYGGGTHCFGSIFEVSPDGTLTTLHSFCAQIGCPDGANPYGGLIQTTNGDLFGTTVAGGAANAGTVFKLNLSAALTTIYNFCTGSCSDGLYPYSGLTLASDGNLYGSTQDGGADGTGTVFKITQDGALTTLFRLGNQAGASQYPLAALVQDTNGKFYGTTQYGGADLDGAVFSFSNSLGPFVKTLPSSGQMGATVRILGTNLAGATSVIFDGTAATFTVVSPSFIMTTVPSGAATGTVQVVTPGATLLSSVPFRVLP